MQDCGGGNRKNEEKEERKDFNAEVAEGPQSSQRGEGSRQSTVCSLQSTANSSEFGTQVWALGGLRVEKFKSSRVLISRFCVLGFRLGFCKRNERKEGGWWPPSLCWGRVGCRTG